MSELWRGEVTVIRHHTNSMLVDHENEEAWIPYSKIHEDSEVWLESDPGETGELVVPLWLAEDRGWR